jgi:hypothetical protein
MRGRSFFDEASNGPHSRHGRHAASGVQNLYALTHPLKGMTGRQFAKRDGCTEGMVRYGLRQERLIAYDDGSIDPDLVGTPWRKRR